MLGAGWYKGDIGFNRIRNYYGKYSAFSCRIFIEYEDGTMENFCTDETWKGADSPILFSEIYDGEIYDARLEVDGWNRNGYDDSNWKSVHMIPFCTDVLSAQSGVKVRQITSVPVKQIFTTPQGDTVLDFGQNMTGWIEFTVKGNSGDKVELQCFEVLDAEGNVYLDNLRTAKAIPCNTKANIYLHDAKEILEAKGLEFDDICMKAKTGSGKYQIIYRI